MHEERIDEQQRGRRKHEDPQAGGRSPERAGEQRDHRHRDRAQHRRLPAGHGAEGHEHHEREHHPATQPRASQQRREQRHHERDVLPGDGGEMREPGGAELLGELGRDPAGVAEQKPGEQGPVDRLQVGRAREHEPAQPVGDAIERRPGRTDADDLGGVHLPDRVLPPPPEVEALQLGAPAAQHQRLPRRQDPQLPGDVARPGHQHPAPARGATVERVDAHEHARVEPAGVGIVDQRRDRGARRCAPRSARASGETVSPWSARCMTAAPSSANASAATTAPTTGARTHTATTHMPTPATSTPVAAAGPAASPTRIPPTSATSTMIGTTGRAGPGLTVRR